MPNRAIVDVGEASMRKRRHPRSPYSHYNRLSRANPKPETEDELKKEFGRRLSNLMDEKGWNQSELARRSTQFLPKPAKGQKQGETIGRDAISNYVRGAHLPRPSYLLAISKALDVSVPDLMPSAAPSVRTTTPEMSMQSAGPGRVRVQINTEVSFDAWRDITNILTKDKGR